MDTPIYNDLLNNVHKFDELCEKMQLMFQKVQDNIASKINAYQHELSERINCIEARISTIRNESIANVEQMIESVKKVRSDSLFINDKLQFVNRSKELIISGVPNDVNKNLYEIFRSIAKRLGYKDEDVPVVDLDRIPSTSSDKSFIVCRFALRTSRYKFFKSYLSDLSLCLKDIGYSPNPNDTNGSLSRIFINESLSKRVRDIRSTAMRMKKAGLIEKVSIRDGEVLVELHKMDPFLPCRTKQALLETLNLSK